MSRLLEWFFMLFLSKKANIIKQEAFFERQKAMLDYEGAKKAKDKYLKKYSNKGRKFVKP